MKKLLMALAVLTALVGCSSSNTVPKQKSNLTVGMIKTKVVEGKTSQTEILELFGSPNLITTNSEGKEVWTYNKSAYESDSSSTSASFAPFFGIGVSGSSSSSRASTSSMDVIITFNKRGIVEKYRVIQAAY